MGIRAFSPAQALQALERILQWSPVQLGVMDVDGRPGGEIAPRLQPRHASRKLIAQDAQTQENSALIELRSRLRELAPEAAEEQFALLVAAEVAGHTATATAKVDLQRSLTQMGGDSADGDRAAKRVCVTTWVRR